MWKSFNSAVWPNIQEGKQARKKKKKKEEEKKLLYIQLIKTNHASPSL